MAAIRSSPECAASERMPNEPVVNPTRTFKEVMARAARTELPATERFSVRICLRRAWVSVWPSGGVSARVSVVMDVASIIAPPRLRAKLHPRNALKHPICYDEGRTRILAKVLLADPHIRRFPLCRILFVSNLNFG